MNTAQPSWPSPASPALPTQAVAAVGHGAMHHGVGPLKKLPLSLSIQSLDQGRAQLERQVVSGELGIVVD